MKDEADLSHKHRSWWNLHVVAELKVREKAESLSHANISIYLEAHISNRALWVHIANHIFCNDV